MVADGSGLGKGRLRSAWTAAHAVDIRSSSPGQHQHQHHHGGSAPDSPKKTHAGGAAAALLLAAPGRRGASRLCGSLDREVLMNALACAGASMADPLMSLVDTFMAGRLGSVAALAALGSNGALFGVVYFLCFTALAVLCTQAMAAANSRGDTEAAGRGFLQALAASGAVGVLLVALLLAAPEALLRLFQTNAEVMPLAKTYCMIRALSLPAALCMNVCQAAFRSLLDLTTPFCVVMAANLANLLLDELLMFRLGWGMAGCGWASVLSQYTGAALFACIIYARRHKFGIPEALAGAVDRWHAAQDGSSGRGQQQEAGGWRGRLHGWLFAPHPSSSSSSSSSSSAHWRQQQHGSSKGEHVPLLSGRESSGSLRINVAAFERHAHTPVATAAAAPSGGGATKAGVQLAHQQPADGAGPGGGGGGAASQHVDGADALVKVAGRPGSGLMRRTSVDGTVSREAAPHRQQQQQQQQQQQHGPLAAAPSPLLQTGWTPSGWTFFGAWSPVATPQPAAMSSAPAAATADASAAAAGGSGLNGSGAPVHAIMQLQTGPHAQHRAGSPPAADALPAAGASPSSSYGQLYRLDSVGSDSKLPRLAHGPASGGGRRLLLLLLTLDWAGFARRFAAMTARGLLILSCYTSASVVAARGGTVVMAAHQVVQQQQQLQMSFAWSFLHVGQSMTANAFHSTAPGGGAKAGRHLALRIVAWAAASCITLAALTYAARDLLSSAFTHDVPVRTLVGGAALPATVMLSLGWNNALEGCLLAADDQAYVVKVYPLAVATALAQLARTAHGGLGLPGVWWGLAGYYFVLLVGFAGRFFVFRSKI